MKRCQHNHDARCVIEDGFRLDGPGDCPNTATVKVMIGPTWYWICDGCASLPDFATKRQVRIHSS